MSESIEPAEERASAGPIWCPANRVAKAEAIAGRVEFVAVSRQGSAISFSASGDASVWLRRQFDRENVRALCESCIVRERLFR